MGDDVSRITAKYMGQFLRLIAIFST